MQKGKPVLALDKKSGKWRRAAGKFPSIIVVFANQADKEVPRGV